MSYNFATHMGEIAVGWKGKEVYRQHTLRWRTMIDLEQLVYFAL